MNDDIEITDELRRRVHREDMRRYRASKGGATDGDKAQARARQSAVSWVRRNKPELWREFLEEAWRSVRP